MTRELSLDERRNAIESRLESTLESARGDYLTPARTVVFERDDRWYGLLVALVYDSVAETPHTPSILRAATAMELFRGYCRLREQLLGRLPVGGIDSVTRDANAALLGSDYLQTAAYSTLASLDDADVGACIGTLASASELIVETLADTDLERPLSPTAFRSFVDGTAGALGRGAAGIGATLADVDDRDRRRFATVGRGFGALRRVQHTFAADAGTVAAASPMHPDRQLQRYTQQRLTEATRALDALSSSADVVPLRAFFERSVPAVRADRR